ncbi:hypothetical protein DVH05_027445 [Phytophthora capsici]|nr:hypothetical protein DVH05_027445 [Phytophthora capsici]
MGRLKELTQREKEDVVRYLLQRKLVHGAQKAAAEMFDINRKAVSAIWEGNDNLSSKKKARVGRKAKRTVDVENSGGILWTMRF